MPDVDVIYSDNRWITSINPVPQKTQDISGNAYVCPLGAGRRRVRMGPVCLAMDLDIIWTLS